MNLKGDLYQSSVSKFTNNSIFTAIIELETNITV